MEDNVNNYEFPDFSPDDDTEDMAGVSIYRPLPKNEYEFPDPSLLPELPEGFNNNDQSLYKDAAKPVPAITHSPTVTMVAKILNMITSNK
jgi:hypothetical protein